MCLIGGDPLSVLFPDVELEEHSFCTFGGFEPMLMDYVLDGYTDVPIPPSLCTAYDTMRHRRAADMPLPTRSLAFILADCAPDDETERQLGYPKIPMRTFLFVGFRIKVGRIGQRRIFVRQSDGHG